MRLVLVLCAWLLVLQLAVAERPKVGLEDELRSRDSSSAFSCMWDPAIGGDKYPAGNGIKLSGDESFGSMGQQVELISDPFDCVAADIKKKVEAMVDVSKDINNWVTKYNIANSKITGCEKKTDELGHSWQATLDMKATPEHIAKLNTMVSDTKKGKGNLKKALEIFEKCVVPKQDSQVKAAQDARKRKADSKFGLFIGVPDNPALSPLFFMIFQGLIQSLPFSETLKENEIVIFKFSYVTLYGMLPKKYRHQLKAVAAEIAGCVKADAATVPKIKADEFNAWWDHPKEHDELKKAFKTEIRPVLQGSSVKQIAFEVRDAVLFQEHGNWHKDLDKVSKDIADWCDALNT